MSPKKHKYSEEFKLEAVRLCQAADRPLAEVAWELGVPPKKLVKWRARLGAIAANGATTPESLSATAQELHRLRQENQRLRHELRQVKKAAAFMSAALKSEPAAPGS